MSNDSRIKLIHSDMKSYGHQMNLGMANTTGEYIGIVETDDYIEPDMMETLYNTINGTDAEYCKGEGELFFEQDGKHLVFYDTVPCAKLWEHEHVDISPRNHPELFESDNFLWNGIYRSDFLKSIKFNETPGAAFQDIGALYRIINRSKHGIYLAKLVYHYRQDNAGASSYNMHGLDFVRHEYESLQDYVSTVSPEWRKIYFYKMVGHTVDRFHYMAFGDFWECSREACEWLRKRINDAFANGDLKKSDFSEDLLAEICLFLKSDYALYDYRKKYYGKCLNKFRHFVDNFKNRNLIIFGSGVWGRNIYLRLICYGLSVCGFCDNDKNKHGQNICGEEIYGLNDVLKKIRNPYFLVANKKYAEDIVHQLKGAGVNSNDIKIVEKDNVGDSFIARILWVNNK